VKSFTRHEKTNPEVFLAEGGIGCAHRLPATATNPQSFSTSLMGASRVKLLGLLQTTSHRSYQLSPFPARSESAVWNEPFPIVCEIYDIGESGRDTPPFAMQFPGGIKTSGSGETAGTPKVCRRLTIEAADALVSGPVSYQPGSW
jgi:hypothetical protein